MDATRFKTLFDRAGIEVVADGRDGSLQIGFSSPATVTYVPVQCPFVEALRWAQTAARIRELPELA